MTRDEILKKDKNEILFNAVMKYKDNHDQDNYNNVLMSIFKDPNQTLILPSRIGNKKDRFDLKSIYDSDDNSYLVAYTDKSYIEDTDETFIIMSVEGIINKVLDDNTCNGLCLDPDTKLDNEDYNQCIILKEHILKIISLLNK